MLRLRFALTLALVAFALTFSACGPDLAEIHKKAQGHLQAGRVAVKAGQLDAAVKEFDETIKLDPKNPEAHMERGKALLQKGDNEQALVSLDAVDRLNPGFVENLRLRANVKFRLGDVPGALRDAEDAAALAPNMLDAQLTLTMMQLESEQFDAAIATSTKILDKNPQQLDALNNRGEAYRLKKDFAKAEQDFDAILKLKPDFALVRANRGVLYHDRGDSTKAIAELDEALRLDQNLVYAWYQLGMIKLSQKDYYGVVTCLSRATSLNPQAHYYHNTYAKFLATCPQADCFDPKVGFEHATKACDLTGHKRADYLATLALCHAALKDFGKAAEVQKQALDLLPKDSPLKGEYEASLKTYNSAPSQAPAEK